MTNQQVTLWRSTAVAGAVIALSACGGGSGNGGEDSPPPTPTVSTAELVQNYVKATEALLAQQMPTSGAERFALVDACYLGNGSTKNMLVSNWSAAQAQNTAYLVGRKMANVQVLTERKTTNADGSARHEVDISYDEQCTDRTASTGLTETLVAGSSSGTCATPQTGNALRALGNRRVAAVGLLSRNRLDVRRQIANGEPTTQRPYALRREVLFSITDPAKVATYAVVSWTSGQGGSTARSLKFLSPRIARDAPEMQGLTGNANYGDGDRFRHCPSNADDNEADATTAACTKLGVTGDTWGWTYALNSSNPSAADLATADTGFASQGLDTAGVEMTFALYADDGWKTVNGQQGKTPVATYKVKLKNASYPFAQLPLSSYPMFNAITPEEAAIAAAFRATGGTATAELQAAQPPAGGSPLAAPTLYSFRQGPKDASATGPVTLRTASLAGTVTADGKKATIPFGGKPDGASATTYGEFGLTYADRNGREIFYGLSYR